jgi:hypothetical protein
MAGNTNLAEKLVAVEKLHGVEVQFLGYLTWFSISDCRVTKSQLEAAFAAAGLDEKGLPKEISPRDAFRRACKAGEIRTQELGNGRFLNILIRDVKSDKDQIIRQLVREVVDAKNIRLEYLPVADLVFTEDNLHVIPRQLMNGHEQKSLRCIEEAYTVEKDHYNGRTIRDIVQDALWGCSPVSVRQSGGVYFVPEKYGDTMKSLQAFVKDVNNYVTTGGRSALYMIPVIDAEEQRQMLQESLEDQVKNETETMIEEMTKMLKSGLKVTQAVAQKYIERAKGLRSLVKEYAEVLDDQKLASKANDELAIKEAMALLEKVEA